MSIALLENIFVERLNLAELYGVNCNILIGYSLFKSFITCVFLLMLYIYINMCVISDYISWLSNVDILHTATYDNRCLNSSGAEHAISWSN